MRNTYIGARAVIITRVGQFCKRKAATCNGMTARTNTTRTTMRSTMRVHGRDTVGHIHLESGVDDRHDYSHKKIEFDDDFTKKYTHRSMFEKNMAKIVFSIFLLFICSFILQMLKMWAN